MRFGLKSLAASTALVAVVAFGASPAKAVPFGPATASLGSFDVPTVTGSTITLKGGTAALSAGTGSLAGSPYVGSGSGTFTYSTLVGTTLANPLLSLFSFSDNVGGHIVFDLSSVMTIAYTSNGTATAIGLYMLGDMYDSNAGLTATPASVTMTFNSTNGSAFSESGSLADPPSPVPEPASLALVGAAVLGLGATRRRKS